VNTRAHAETAVAVELPLRASAYPRLRFMGSKHRLLPWLHGVLGRIDFDSALDAFSGSGCVSYLLKAMGKQVTANDLLNFTATIATAVVENAGATIAPDVTQRLLEPSGTQSDFIARTFAGVFYDAADLRFLDVVSANVRNLGDPYQRALAQAALFRSCIKRQPRGVFTVAGDPEHYKDGRRDLRLPLEQHFLEQIDVYNGIVFDNGRQNRALRGDVFDVDERGFDLVYLDPPYVPRADDNCYIKRYHFLEGLSCCWQGVEIVETSRVRKIAKPYTPFSYRRDATAAFERLFAKFSRSVLVLSYSSNGYPDLDTLVRLMRRHGKSVEVHEKQHRYHFGTHGAVTRAVAREYLIVGR